MPEITKETTLAEILENPQTQEILSKHKIPCLTCPFAKIEMDRLKIGEICQMYGLNLKTLLEDLNKV